MAHTTVLLHETIDGLGIQPGDIVFDGTLGGGGHTAEVCKRHSTSVTMIATDRDADAIARSKERLAAMGCEAELVQASFRAIDEVLGARGADRIMLDLGISSDQLNDSGRGFTFRKSEPLEMTMHKAPGEHDLTAYQIVNEWGEESIADIIYGYGEERYSRRIAKAIIDARHTASIKTTDQLAEIISRAVPAAYRRGRIHPATKSFQALRIAVNDELGSLTDALAKGFASLHSGGRIAVISFHSLEDRIVKRFFKEKEQEELATLITKKPIVPTDEEIRANPRSRSAKLRILEKK